MSKVGNFGKLIKFSTSSKKVLTFSSLNQEVSATWAKHERNGGKQKSEFLHPNLRTLSLTIVLDANLGVRPRATMKEIETAIETGRVENLVIGSEKVGDRKWKILKMSEAWDIVLSKGELAKATCQLTLEEY